MRRVYLVLTALLLSASIFAPHGAEAQTEQRCFNETGKCIDGVIRQYWERNGGLAVFGFPITDRVNETNAEGFTGPTQWFERDRLEDHGPQGVMAGRLGAQKLAMEGRPWEGLPKVSGAGANCRYFPETGHSLCPPFRAYWEANGGLARFGFPISEPNQERNATGWTGTTQHFERRRMEHHTENRPPHDVLLGLLGSEVRAGGSGGGGGGGGGGNACANIEAPVRMERQPENGCIRRGDVIGFGVYGYEPGTAVGAFITDETGLTVGTNQTFNADAAGDVIVYVDTDNWFGFELLPGNYRFVVQDANREYLPSYANFRVLP